MQKYNNPNNPARQAGFSKWRDKIQSPAEVRKRFWEKVSISGADDCWIWHGSLTESGYGSLTHKARRWKSHRFSFFLTHGGFDLKMDVLHKCDNPPCCNPKHLELGTQKENSLQMSIRGRWGTKPRVFGESHGMSKLNGKDVIKIRLLKLKGITNRNIGLRFGVTEENIGRIIRRETWRHI